MHLWLTYKVVQQDGNWPLPQLSERRNVYWTGQTKRLVNGKTAAGQDQWLPAALPAQASPAIAHQVTLPQSGHILANPFADSRWQLPAGKHFAVILDDSYSMNAHQQAVKETFNWLQKQIVGQNKIDLYQTAAAPAQPQRLDNLKQFDANQAVFYGTLQPRQMLQQFQQLRGDTPYDAVILITDAGSYELSQDSKEGLAMPAPLWMLHLGGFQPAYDDATLEAIQSSGGNVSTQIQDVMRRIATQPGLGEGTSLLNITDGYAWFLSRSPNPTAAKDDEGFAPLAARQWVAQVSEAVKPTDLTQLDAIHAVAKKYEIVTPYSSMIVLVNDQQREDLKRAEQQRDRFDREVEDQQLPQPTGVDQISAVPEPAEGLLLIIGLGGLGLLYHQQKQLRSLG
jgi:putative PEP-CTERM system integral membrane protein